MAKHCLVHDDRPAVSMCHQCHKPLCKSCVTVTPQGQFCSTECGIMNREVKSRLGPRERGAKGKGFMLVVLVVIMAIIVLHFVARGNESWRVVDLLGKVLGYPDPR